MKTQITTLQKQITGWQGQVKQLLGAAAQASGQAAKLANDGGAVELAWIANPSKAQWAAIDARSGHSLPDQGGSDEDKADDHIRKARQSSAIGQHAVAIKHLARASALTQDDGKQAAINTLSNGVARQAINTGQGKQLGLARTWDELAGVIALSAETGRLAVTPNPYGKPGGPGLYRRQMNKTFDYLENIVHALMRKGMDKGKATAIASGIDPQVDARRRPCAPRGPRRGGRRRDPGDSRAGTRPRPRPHLG